MVYSEILWDSVAEPLLSFSPLSLDREKTYPIILQKSWWLSEEEDL